MNQTRLSSIRSGVRIRWAEEEEEEMEGCNDKSSASSMEKETYGESKYGGIAPKKPLISKDHERAYFDSADWVLGKQAENGSARAAIESLKPKLKRTPHHQLPPRKPTCASS
uniref:Endosulphine n=1 Tax=Oryza brachyantha TaxID=4533 RepID=J3ND51_ORYBR